MNMKVLRADGLLRYISQTHFGGMYFSKSYILALFTLVTQVEFSHFQQPWSLTLPCRRVRHA